MIIATIYSKCNRKVKLLLLVFISVITTNCVDEFDIQTENFESILVVNTSITNELKKQKVLLSRTFKFEENGPSAEQGATVRISDNNVDYVFEEVSPGVYISIDEFSAIPGREYQLSITTTDGTSYISDKATLPTENSSITQVTPVQMVNNNGVEGVGILVDSFDPTGSSVYYRYQYEETYKIVARFWVPVDLTTSFEFVDRPDGQEICFNSRASNSIIITDTRSQEEDRVNDFLIRFIEAEDISVAERYSILVRQIVQSREAYGFYQTLSNFSESESLFSQVQPGFVSGNIISEKNKNERVLGFFEVAAVSQERIFFDREDIINDLPRFSPGCDRIAPVQSTSESIEEFERRLQDLIRSGNVKFLEEQRGEEDEGTFVFVPRGCGDCSVFGSSAVPSFWVD